MRETLHIRPALQADIAAVEAFYNDAPEYMPPAARLVQDGVVRVATTADGGIVGVQVLRPSGFVWIGVVAQQRRQGIGTRLLDDAIRQATERGMTELNSQVIETHAAGNAFCARFGFNPFVHAVNLFLDMSTWDEAVLVPSLEQAQASGVQFATFAELGDTPENRRRLYELNKALSATIPRDQPQEFAPYETYVERRITPQTFPHEGIFIALLDREWIGMAQASLDGDISFTQMTGVLPPYRHQGIAQALKLLSLRFVQRSGCRIVRTFNDVTNPSMIAVNEKAGFRQGQRFYLVRRKPLAAANG